MIPPPDVAASITPEYVSKPRVRVIVEEADKEKMIHEVSIETRPHCNEANGQLAGFYPRGVCDEITSKARDGISETIGRVENWANMQISEDEDEIQREINIVRLFTTVLPCRNGVLMHRGCMLQNRYWRVEWTKSLTSLPHGC